VPGGVNGFLRASQRPVSAERKAPGASGAVTGRP
jgi:hypothetical protein